MIDPNITQLANLTETFEPVNLTAVGMINNTQPIAMQITGNVSAVVSQPAFTMMLGIQIAILAEMTIIMLLLLHLYIKRRV